MKKGMYDFNVLSDCKNQLKQFKEVVCSGYTITSMFNFCMSEGITIQIEKISETKYKIKAV